MKKQQLKIGQSQAESGDLAEQLDGSKRYSRSRRRLLQSLAAGGAAVTVKGMPEEWTKPVLDITIVPAHAQCTVAATLACEIDQPFTDDLTGDPPFVLDPVRGSNGPWLTGGENGEIDAFDPGQAVGNTINFTFNHIAATLTPASAGPVSLNVNADAGANGGAALVNQGASQTIQPNESGFVSFGNMGQDVIVGFSSDQESSPGDPSTATVHFMLNACDQDCVIDVVFAEGFIAADGP